MLVELNVPEQRLKAVLEVLDGATVVGVARRYLVGRQTVHECLRRYAADGLKGLVDQSSKPVSCPYQRAVVLANMGLVSPWCRLLGRPGVACVKYRSASVECGSALHD